MPTCGNGHESDWDDYCSVCGVALAGAPASVAAAPEPTEQPAGTHGPICSNCSEPHTEGDVFCENCGYDFLSGTLPGDDSAEGLTHGAVTEHDDGVAIIEVDLDFFERMAFTGVAAPDVLPEPVRLELPPTDILVGRHSESRGTFPEIDLSTIFGEDSPATDPAVSSNHCRLHRGSTGWTLTDLDSTNGTYLDGSSESLKAGTPISLIPGTPFNVGAWTKITIK